MNNLSLTRSNTKDEIILQEPDLPSPVKELDAHLAGLDLTDVGNAERLIAWHGHDLRYNQAENRWYIWDGVRWAAEVSDDEVLKCGSHRVFGITGWQK